MKSKKIKRIAARKRRQKLAYKLFGWVLMVLVCGIGLAMAVMCFYVYSLIRFR